jgi:DNA-binding response OmpR family regulator
MKALIVDDDRTLAELLAFTLRRAGFETYLAFDAPGAAKVFSQTPMDIIILDVNLPGTPVLKDGFAVCSLIRQRSDVPIILLTVRDEEEDVLHGLEIGADDYILKPFSPRQLVARIQAVMRRSTPGYPSNAAPYIYQDVKFEPARREFTRQGHNPVVLTRLEAKLIEQLMLNPHHIFPMETLIDHIWGPGAGSKEMLRQLIRRLRLKIEQDPDHPELIQNLPGIGYGFAINP